MKNFAILLLLLIITATFASCLKGTGNPRPYLSIGGNWTLVNDSTVNNSWGVFNQLPPKGTNYVGQPGDYYNFTTGGTLYVKEGNVKDTSTYTLKLDTLLELTYSSQNGYKFNSPQTSDYKVTNLTAHTVTLTGGLLLTPETAYSHIINLKK